MTYDTSERSTQDGEPIEIYSFALATTTLRYTSHPEDVTVSSQTYTAIPISRDPANIMVIGQVRELTVTIPVDLALAQTLIGNGIPPRDIVVTIERYHPGTAIRRIWRGAVDRLETDGVFARLTVPNLMDRAFMVRLPLVTSQRLCVHDLYDTGCAVDREYAIYQTEPFMTACEAVSQSGTALVVSNMNGPGAVPRDDQWARYGEVRRSSDGERRSIVAQVGATLTLDMPFASIAAGDDLEVYAGCDHSVETCRDKFANVANFGGHPQLPNANPHAPTGYGVMTSA